MTQSIVATAKEVLQHANIDGWTSHDGPPAIQGEADGLAATSPLLALIEQTQGTDAIVIACFDDTALREARAIADCPVIGIGQAAFHVAALHGARFSVVTTLDVSVPIIEANIKAYGFEPVLGRVRASQIPVLDLEGDTSKSFEIITAEAKAALAEDKIDAVILGCAGMTGLAAHLRAHLNCLVIDGVEAAAHLAFGLAKARRAL